jgi:predicted DNA-binding transcriptional regulator AlpA
MDELMSNRNMLNSTFDALRKRDKSKKIEPWTLNIRDVVDFVPVNKSTIYNWIKVGYFPKHIDKCPNGKYRGKHLWRMAEVLAFLDKCIANDNSYKDHMNELGK